MQRDGGGLTWPLQDRSFNLAAAKAAPHTWLIFVFFGARRCRLLISLAVFSQIALSKTVNTYQQCGFGCRRQGKNSVAGRGEAWREFVHVHRGVITLASLALCSSNVGASRGSGIYSWRLLEVPVPRMVVVGSHIWRGCGGNAGFDGSERGVAAKRVSVTFEPGPEQDSLTRMLLHQCFQYTWGNTFFFFFNLGLHCFSERLCNKKLKKIQPFPVWHQATDIASSLVATPTARCWLRLLRPPFSCVLQTFRRANKASVLAGGSFRRLSIEFSKDLLSF